MRNSDGKPDPTKGDKEKKLRKNLQSFDAEASKSIVLRDLPFCCTSKDLQIFIAEHLGVPPNLAVVLRNPDGKTLHYGCALFSTAEDASEAIQKVHMKRLYGRDIRVLPYSSASLREVSRSGDVLISFITLSAMMESITEQNIRNIVEEYGDIDYIAIRHHKFSKEGIQNGFGFVTMTSQEENRRVLDNVKGIEINNVIYTSEESKQLRSSLKGVEISDSVEDAPSELADLTVPTDVEHPQDPSKFSKIVPVETASSSLDRTRPSSHHAEGPRRHQNAFNRYSSGSKSYASVSNKSNNNRENTKPVAVAAPNLPPEDRFQANNMGSLSYSNNSDLLSPVLGTSHASTVFHQPPRPYSPSPSLNTPSQQIQVYSGSSAPPPPPLSINNGNVVNSSISSSISPQSSSYNTQSISHQSFSQPYSQQQIYSSGQNPASSPYHHQSPIMISNQFQFLNQMHSNQYPLPPQSLPQPGMLASPGYQYNMSAETNNSHPSAYMINAYPHSHSQSNTVSPSPLMAIPPVHHEQHMSTLAQHQGPSQYVHNGMNLPVVSLVPLSTTPSAVSNTYSNGQLIPQQSGIPSATTPTPYHIQYPTSSTYHQSVAHHQHHHQHQHHQIQTPIYQQQHHHSQFVSSSQPSQQLPQQAPNSSSHSYHHSQQSSPSDQQRR